MNKKIYVSLLSAMVAGASTVMAQDLKKDVVIERDVEPAVRAANRLSSVSPTVLSPKVENRRLSLSEYTGTGTLNCRLSRLEPAAYADTFAVSPYRGYAAVGYLPSFNLGASAGYRFVDTEQTKLGAWLQYNGNSYNSKGDQLYGGDVPYYIYKLKRHTFSLGAEFENQFRTGSLGIDFAYTHDYTTQPVVADDFTQSTNKAEFGIGWKAKSHSLPWNLGLSLNYFGFGNEMPDDEIIGGPTLEVRAVNEFIFGIKGGIEKEFNDQLVGLDVDARFQNLNRLAMALPVPSTLFANTELYPMLAYTDYYGKRTLGITSLSPHYIYSNGKLTAKLGVKVDISTGNSNGGVYFSPDVNVAYAATSQLAFFGKVDGGKELNSLAELYDDSQFMSSAYTYERSSVPFDAKVGMNVGPLSGFTAQIWVGYSKAKDWLMPASHMWREFFVPMDVKGFRYGARVAWQYNDVFKIHAQAEGAPTGAGKGYYRWRDNARWVVNAGLTVTPIKPLDINVDWNLRTGRHLFDVDAAVGSLGSVDYAYWNVYDYDLGKANSLDLGATYRITDAFSVFANVENVLGYHWNITTELKNQGIHGLVGVTYKF
jgi:hypothetical protein